MYFTIYNVFSNYYCVERITLCMFMSIMYSMQFSYSSKFELQIRMFKEGLLYYFTPSTL